MKIIDDRYQLIIAKQKELLSSFSTVANKLSQDETAETIQLMHDNLDRLFSIVFIGEFSTGKSSLINVLIGEDIQEEGITPTTDNIMVLRYDEQKDEFTRDGIKYVLLPDEKLKNLSIVDTPGTNVTAEQHEKLTRDFIPKADMVLFIIGIERALTGTEAELIEFIKSDWLKNIVFVLNKIDVAKDQQELDKVTEHTREGIKNLFGIDPTIFPVSSKLAKSARLSSDTVQYERSGIKALEDYIFSTLSEEHRVRMKIKSTSELAINLCTETLGTLDENVKRINEDMKGIEDFKQSLERLKDDVVVNSRQFTERIRSRMLEFKTRGIEYIDDLIRLSNLFKLLSKDKVAKEFEDKVSRQTVAELEKDMDDMVRWTERSANTLLENALEFYNKSLRPDKSSFTRGFNYDRSRLIETVRSELEKRRTQMDPALLGSNLVDSARAAIASVLGIQVGSLAIGATFVAAFSSLLADITGVLTTIAIMATAFAILPKKRRDAMKEFNSKVDSLTEGLTSSIDSQLKRDFEGIKIQIADSLLPLKNFYETELADIEESRKNLEQVQTGFEEIIKYLDQG